MTSGIVILDRIVASISIAVQRLRIGRAGDHRIRLDEAAQCGIVIARAIVVQAQPGFAPLAGEAAVGGQACPLQAGPHFAIRIVAGVTLGDFSPARIRRQAGRSQVIAVQLREHAAFPHRHTLGAEGVVLDRSQRYRRHHGAPRAYIASLVPRPHVEGIRVSISAAVGRGRCCSGAFPRLPGFAVDLHLHVVLVCNCQGTREARSGTYLPLLSSGNVGSGDAT